MKFWKWGKGAKRTPARSDVREFLRHTVDVPIEYSHVSDDGPDGLPAIDAAHPSADGSAGVGDSAEAHSRNVGFGGLAFTTRDCPKAGDLIELRIPSVSPPFVAKARVAWCRPEDGEYLVGAAFLDASDAFRSRMVQQVCSIENYRKEVLEEEGRELTVQEASAEWIERYANRFPTAKPTSPTSPPPSSP